MKGEQAGGERRFVLCGVFVLCWSLVLLSGGERIFHTRVYGVLRRGGEDASVSVKDMRGKDPVFI